MIIPIIIYILVIYLFYMLIELHYYETDEDELVVVLLSCFWPITIVLFILCLPFAFINKFIDKLKKK